MAAKGTNQMTSSKTKTRNAKPKTKAVRLRKDGKPDGRSTRLKRLHAEAKELHAEVNVAVAVRRGRGQPTKYRPDMCQRVEELGLQGKTRHQTAVELGIHYTTLLTWERLHPEFREALKAAHDASLAYWQGIVQEAIRGDRKVNGLALIFGTKNMFPEHFKDQTSTEVKVRHQLSDGFEAFLVQIADERRATQAKLIDMQAGEDD